MNATSLLPAGIKNLIFDLGGVILNIDHSQTAEAFRRHGVADFQKCVSLRTQEPLFDLIETGELDDAGFRSKLCGRLGVKLADADFDAAWNALLLDIPRERLDLIARLRRNFRVFLLSNTNRIHIESVNRYLQREFSVPSLHGLFDKCYLSFEMGMRKPHVAIYRHVLEDAGLTGGETVFLDDAPLNIEGAKRAGMHVIHVTPERDILACLAGACSR